MTCRCCTGIAVAVVVALVLGAALAARAHEITYKGTVISADARTVKITAPNEKTKKPEAMTFDHDKETKILRGDRLVTFSEAGIRKGEKIAVTINHDDFPNFALVIRLDEKK